MRSLILMCSIATLLCLGSNYVVAQDEPYPLSVDVKVIRQYEEPYKRKVPREVFVPKGKVAKAKMYAIAITVKNASTKPVFFWIMCCSWENNFLINNDYMTFVPHSCDKNNPTLIPLKSGESQTLNVTLMKSIKFDFPCRGCDLEDQVKTTKLGLIVATDIYSSAGDFTT